ncbi:trypsin-like serine protease [Martensiomyces pterosporus]|nr:trypsin-like serine protease [Martensiomyces pterosporus]
MLFTRIAPVHVLGAVAAVLAAAHPDDSSSAPLGIVPRIVGGSPASSSAFSFVGKVTAKNPGYDANECTGSLITPWVVLTTAKCFVTSANTWDVNEEVTVAFGSSLQNVYTARRLLISTLYNHNTEYHNIGLIYLNTAVPSAVATPVRVITSPPSAGTNALALGYGLTANSKDASAGQLMQVQLGLQSQSFCAKMNSYFDSSSQLCTDGSSGKDTCLGDGGGPLLAPLGSGELGLLGFASMRTAPQGASQLSCGQRGTVSYYERAGYWIDWMQKEGNLTFSDLSVGGSSPNSPPANSNSRGTDSPTAGASTAVGVPSGSFTFTRQGQTSTALPTTADTVTTTDSSPATPAHSTFPTLNGSGSTPAAPHPGNGSTLSFQVAFSDVLLPFIAALYAYLV